MPSPFDWDLWLGVASMRPYSKEILLFDWRKQMDVPYGAAACDHAVALRVTRRPAEPHLHELLPARSDGNNGRVWGGMHYPSTVEISDRVGQAIAKYVNRNAMQRSHGRR